MKMLVLIFSLCFLLFLSLNSVRAASAGDVVINEIAWMGTANSANDEWIELYNNTDLPINIEGWLLKAADGSPMIKLAGSFPANGFYLLERTDDNTAPNVPADQIYTGALNNKGEKLELYDNLGNLIDSVDAGAGWPAGNNPTKQTMERKNVHNWQTSQNSGGTPKTKNSLVTEAIAMEAEPQSIKPQPIKGLAAVSEPIQQVQGKQIYKPLFPLPLALAMAIFSVVIILVLKNKVKVG